jgi:hypothetical protein
MDNSGCPSPSARLRTLQVADELRNSIKRIDLTKRFKERMPASQDPNRPYLCPKLRELLVPEYESLSDWIVASEMKSRFEGRIEDYEGTFALPGSNIIIPDHQFRKICLILWSFTSKKLADIRRYDVMKELGYGWSLSKWKTPPGPEWQICLRLSGYMIEQLDKSVTASEAGDGVTEAA